MKNKPEKAESEYKKAQKYCDKPLLLLNSATLNMATYYSMTEKKEDVYKIFKELYLMDSSNSFGDYHMLFLMNSNNPQEFIEAYDLTIDESFPKDGYVMARKAIALMDLGRFGEAIPILEDALNYTDDKDGLEVIHFQLGVSYCRLDELDKAICEFENAREYNDDPSLLLQIANCYEMAKQNEKALEIFKELSEIDPDNQDIKIKIENLKREINGKDLLYDNKFNSIKEAYIQKDIYFKNMEYEKAIEVLDLIIEFQPEQPIPWIDKGYAYYNLGKYEEAIKCFDKSLEYDPRSEYSLFYKALVYMEEDDFENSQDMMVKALTISPDNTMFLKNYCYILIKFGKYEEAINIADKTLSINPDPDDYINKAVALENLNRLDEAIECFNKVLKINPNSIDVLNYKGNDLFKLNRVDEAIECYDKALKINQNSIDVLNNKAFALFKLNRVDESIKCYDEALKINPNFFEVWVNKGLTLENLNRLDEAAECYNNALSISPNNSDMLNRLSVIKAQKNSSVNSLEEALNQADAYWEEKEYEKVLRFMIQLMILCLNNLLYGTEKDMHIIC